MEKDGMKKTRKERAKKNEEKRKKHFLDSVTSRAEEDFTTRGDRRKKLKIQAEQKTNLKVKLMNIKPLSIIETSHRQSRAPAPREVQTPDFLNQLIGVKSLPRHPGRGGRGHSTPLVHGPPSALVPDPLKPT
ncbi:unnamed protein product [Nezara viridula]|uniref:Uncharacterized protein n=1 Tax=Nezara viridula TaxID=85310 RepID=A0A9P0MUL7_NEZVI|nr:unnamed protein product [Nezara viridula]